MGNYAAVNKQETSTKADISWITVLLAIPDITEERDQPSGNNRCYIRQHRMLTVFTHEDSVLNVRTSWENENSTLEHMEYNLIPQKCLWSFIVPVFPKGSCRYFREDFKDSRLPSSTIEQLKSHAMKPSISFVTLRE